MSPLWEGHKRKLKKNNNPPPKVRDTILEVEVEEEEREKIKYVTLSQRTFLMKAMEEEGRRSSTIMPKSIEKEPIYVTTLEDKK